MRQEKRQLEADVADARRSTAKLRRRLAEMRATSEVMHRRTMTLLSHSQTATSAAFSASPHGADCSDEESTDHAAADHQQVSIHVTGTVRQCSVGPCAGVAAPFNPDWKSRD